MAIRTPLKLDSTNLKEMSSTDTGNIISRMVYLYMTDPSVTLSYVANSGSLASMDDTRTQASAATSHASSFQTAGAVSTITVTHDKINEATATLSAPADTNNIRFPVYTETSINNNIKSMSLTDMYDTFVNIDAGGQQGASIQIPAAQPYKIHTSTTPPSGYTLVSSNPIFWDTQADISEYTAAGIAETRDQPETVTNYYLHKSNGTAVTAPTPMYIDSNQNLKEYTSAEFDAVLKEVIRYTSVNLTSNKLRFYIGGSGTTCGTGIVNKKYNGDSGQQQLQVGDDYRTQRFPAGTSVAVNTYYLKARKE
jgi:hypothetical protein